jgi:hypothetical protein
MSVQSGTTGRVSRLVVSEDGYYDVNGSVTFAANNDGFRLVYVTKNDEDSGANKRHSLVRNQAVSSSAATQMVFSTTIPLLSRKLG